MSITVDVDDPDVLVEVVVPNVVVEVAGVPGPPGPPGPPGQPGGATLVDAKGDLLVGTANDTLARLAVGANTYVLTADSATATGMKWAAPTGGGGGAPTGPAGGDLTGTYPNPGIAAGVIVDADIHASAAIAQSKVSGLSTSLAALIPKSLVTAKGDLVVATGSATPARLGVGPDANVLTADAASAGGVKWAPMTLNANVVQVANFADVVNPLPSGTLVILTP